MINEIAKYECQGQIIKIRVFNINTLVFHKPYALLNDCYTATMFLNLFIYFTWRLITL